MSSSLESKSEDEATKQQYHTVAVVVVATHMLSFSGYMTATCFVLCQINSAPNRDASVTFATSLRVNNPRPLSKHYFLLLHMQERYNKGI